MHTKLSALTLLTSLAILTLQAPSAAGDVSGRSYISAAGGHTTLSVIDLDINKDGVVSSNEVGTILFKLYDRDGNGIVDKDEYERGINVSVTTGQVDTSDLAYNINGNIVPPGTPQGYDELKRSTGLTRFDAASTGLSPHELLNKDMKRQLNLKSWLDLYAADHAVEGN